MLDSALNKNITLLLSTIKARSTTMPMLFHDDPAKKSVRTHKVEAQVDIKQVRAIAAVATAG
jgi:hypothetical protein